MTRAGSLPIRIFSFLITFSIVLSACGLAGGEDKSARINDSNLPNQEFPGVGGDDPSQPSVSGEAIPVDPVFARFYEIYGGEDVFGPAISEATQVKNQVHQYVQAGLMVYDPEAPETERYRWAPLGEGFDIREDPVENPGGDSRYINGHIVYPAFESKYDELGGVHFVGEPLTEAQYNLQEGRIEQYFGNLGFYIRDDDGSQQVLLMAYGAYECDVNCRELDSGDGLPQEEPVLVEPFRSIAAELGLSFIGKTLTEPRSAFDGNREVVFENLVLVQKPNSTSEVFARPIVTLLGLSKEAPVEEGPAQELMVFVPTENGLGHHVPVAFLDFLDRRGGLAFFGEPVSEVFKAEEGIFRQCFTTACVDLNINGEAGDRLSLAPLGSEYFAAYGSVRPDDFSLRDVEIKVWERQPSVSTDEAQEIFVAIRKKGKPLANFEPVINLTMPDGQPRVLIFQPTNAEGMASKWINPIDAPNGTLIPYEVCLKFGLDKKCTQDNYLIWNYPK